MKIKNKADIVALLETSESMTVEYKSSKTLGLGSKNDIKKFIVDDVVKAVCAFLNSEGGTLIIGIDERKDGPNVISDGISRSVFSWETLRDMIVDRIQPPVADLVGVQSVRVDDGEQVPKYAFCVQVKSGNTAYQSIDKYYYCRRDGASVAMDDKDIRLRMLSGDKPRIKVELISEFTYTGQIEKYINGVSWNIVVENIGLRTVKRCFVSLKMTCSGLTSLGEQILKSHGQSFFTECASYGSDHTGLMPSQIWKTKGFDISSATLRGAAKNAEVRADLRVFIDDGFPGQIVNYDVLAALPEDLRKEWLGGEN